jgi:hypothetical protein
MWTEETVSQKLFIFLFLISKWSDKKRKGHQLNGIFQFIHSTNFYRTEN